MFSNVEVCNLALSFLGQEPIMTLDDSTKASRLCKQFYDYCRHSMLRLFPWAFALTESTLASDADTGRFNLPSDCLRLVHVGNSEYKLEGNAIIATGNQVHIYYVKDVTDVTKMDALFKELLALKIAKEICYNLTADMNLVQLMEQKYQIIEAEARHTQSVEQRPQEQGETPWITVRY